MPDGRKRNSVRFTIIDSDWTEITQLGYGLCLRKKDGTVWLSSPDFQNLKGQTNDLGHGLVLKRMESLEGIRFTSTALTEPRYSYNYRVGVRADGTFLDGDHHLVLAHQAGQLEACLLRQVLRELEQLGRDVALEDHALRETRTVAQLQEDQLAAAA